MVRGRRGVNPDPKTLQGCALTHYFSLGISFASRKMCVPDGAFGEEEGEEEEEEEDEGQAEEASTCPPRPVEDTLLPPDTPTCITTTAPGLAEAFPSSPSDVLPALCPLPAGKTSPASLVPP
ncbi:hypothetical protein PAPYR_10866 [Paratrimastix pyriformis]|uniref:Uncharacterized protein n=1 Tax=Paratrimastix pyriformis TaxID=342808 RepID=A0ABQ8U7M1_9EUKA|nr:hypothetical protein PAPYR_10866 [Paratrimastix pyriformis]